MPCHTSTKTPEHRIHNSQQTIHTSPVNELKDKPELLTGVGVTEGGDRHVDIKASSVRLIVVNDGDIRVVVWSGRCHGDLRLSIIHTHHAHSCQSINAVQSVCQLNCDEVFIATQTNDKNAFSYVYNVSVSH